MRPDRRKHPDVLLSERIQRRPGVPPGLEMLRTSYMATHEDVHLDKILNVFSEVGKKMGVIS